MNMDIRSLNNGEESVWPNATVPLTADPEDKSKFPSTEEIITHDSAVAVFTADDLNDL